MKVYVLIHQHRYGTNIEVFKKKRDAVKEYKNTMVTEYSERYGLDASSTDDELYEATCGESSMYIQVAEFRQ